MRDAILALTALMEGPSIVIATEDLKPFVGKLILKATGAATLPLGSLSRSKLLKTKSWGKHLLLFFENTSLRIHFLMFGSYRIDKPRPKRVPKLQLTVRDHQIYFYSCAIRVEPSGFEQNYDYEIDLMSKNWNHKRAVVALSSLPSSLICDALMDQTIFAGLGNIMKNEILYLLKMHPETKIADLGKARIREIAATAREYSMMFYEWKKLNILKRNWHIMRKKICPRCNGRVTKRATGKLQRISHYCPRCQTKGI